MKNKSFPSKVLLFGEYSVIKHSNALAMAYPLFEGHLTFSSNEGRKDPELKALSSYLNQLDEKDELPFDFDLASFDFDVGQGLIFESSIPQGYGVGSSGALCAALYDRYVKNPNKWNTPIETLKKHFCLMESHFHGSSSGLDPLVSFLNKPVVKNRETGFRVTELPEMNTKGATLFLLNTGRSRKTEPLVNLFLEKCKNEDFSILCENVLSPLTDECISSFLSADVDKLWKTFKKLSQFQLEHFSPMIPTLYRGLWKEGLDDEGFYLKLCGAGGGGFLMGMTKDFKKCSRILKDFEIRAL
jgi:mevalonate kinase